MPETSATTEAATSTEAVATEPPAETTTEAVEAPTSTEAVPAKPPRPLAGDGTFPEPIRMTLSENEIDWKTADLDRRMQRVRVEARVSRLVRATPATSTASSAAPPRRPMQRSVDPWTGGYAVWRFNPTRTSGFEIETGAAPSLAVAALVRPPRPNVLQLTCAILPGGGRIVLAANGRRITSISVDATASRYEVVGVTAIDGSGGGLDVVFDGVVVEAG